MSMTGVLAAQLDAVASERDRERAHKHSRLHWQARALERLYGDAELDELVALLLKGLAARQAAGAFKRRQATERQMD